MLLIEGVPALLAGVFNYFWITDRPEQAKWLKPEQRNWLIGELEKDPAARKDVKHLGVVAAITNPKVLFLSAIYFIYQLGNLGIGLWMPQIIKGLSSGLTNFEIGLIAMVPYAVATVAMVLWSLVTFALVFAMGPWLWQMSIAIFVGAWVMQFIGHKIKGKKPSFFEDLQYLWVGPLFVLSKLFAKVSIRW